MDADELSRKRFDAASIHPLRKRLPQQEILIVFEQKQKERACQQGNIGQGHEAAATELDRTEPSSLWGEEESSCRAEA